MIASEIPNTTYLFFTVTNLTLAAALLARRLRRKRQRTERGSHALDAVALTRKRHKPDPVAYDPQVVDLASGKYERIEVAQ